MAKSIADQLLERRAALLKQAQDVAQKGVAEGRDLTVEEQTSFDQMIAEAGKLSERAAAINEGEQRARELEDSFKNVTGADKRSGPSEDGVFGKWAREARIGDGYDIRPVYGAEKRALERARGGVEQRAMSASGGVGADGVYGQLWEYAIATSQLLQAGVDIINTADGNTLPFPAATVHAQTSDTVAAANAALASSDATITTVNSTVSKYAYMTLVPTELVQDATFDLEGYIARAGGRELGRRIAKIASAAAVAGFTTAGSTGPTGTTTSLGNQATAGQGTDLLIDLFHSVLPDYRTDASWTLADPTFAIVRKLKSGTTGDTVFGSASGPLADTILNKPVYVDPFLPSPAANAKTIYFGDWSALKVRIAGGLRFERSNEYGFGNDQVAFRAIVRTGAVVVDPNAVKYFAQSAT
jgi:HK97 family phage major capsid protein